MTLFYSLSRLFSSPLQSRAWAAHGSDALRGAVLWPRLLRLRPTASANDFRFSILGDRTGDAQPGVYERIWSELDALHPDFVINVGDTIQGGNDATAAAEWRALVRLGRYRYPIFFTPGNHDIWSPASVRLRTTNPASGVL